MLLTKWPMSQLDDKELEGRAALSTVTVDPFSEGLDILRLSNEEIGTLGEFWQEFYEKVEALHGNQITRTALSMIQGGIFAVGTRKLDNPEWKEHCASSLREIFHEWDGNGQLAADFCRIYRGKDGKLNQEEKDAMKGLWNHYQYFTGIAHHGASTIRNSLVSILKDNSLKLEDCYQDEVFLKRVGVFFNMMGDIRNLSKSS